MNTGAHPVELEIACQRKYHFVKTLQEPNRIRLWKSFPRFAGEPDIMCLGEQEMECKRASAVSLGFVMLFLPTTRAIPSQHSNSATIYGRITDCTGGAMPGVEVIVTKATVAAARTAVSDGQGQYRIQRLPPGVYALTFQLPNFRTFRRTGIELAAGDEIRLDAGIQPGCGLEAAVAVLDLPTLWRSVDAVVLLRTQGAVQSGLRSTLRGRWCEVVATEYRATILEVFRRFLGEPRSSALSLLQADAGVSHDRGETRTGCRSPYPVGEELFVFAKWNTEEQIFEEIFAVPVHEGKVISPYIREISLGVKAETFVQILRSMMETPKPLLRK